MNMSCNKKIIYRMATDIELKHTARLKNKQNLCKFKFVRFEMNRLINATKQFVIQGVKQHNFV